VVAKLQEVLGQSPDATAMIRDALPTLPDALRIVAEFTLREPAAVATSSIREVAERAGASTASVTRFCRAVGYSGFQELRLQLAQELGRQRPDVWSEDFGLNISQDDSLDRVVSIIAQSDMRAIQQTIEKLDLAAVAQAANLIANSRRIDIYGSGGSGIVALEAEARLFRIGCDVRAWPEIHAASTSAALLTASDVALGISHSGYTKETIEAMLGAQQAGARTIALTSNAKSPLGQLADVTLTTSVLETSFRHGGLAARHSQLVVVDCLYIKVAQLTGERTALSLGRTAGVAPQHLVNR
jgi:DNA-binding MurR/RpiR family transcriptional regulator